MTPRRSYDTLRAARAPREGELSGLCPELFDLIQEGRDEAADLMVRERPELAMAQAHWVETPFGPNSGVFEPMAVMAASRCCFSTAKTMIELGFNPELCDALGHTVLTAACLGVGVNSHHRLLLRRSKEEWALARDDFLEWLLEREESLGLHSQALSARVVSGRLSLPHCRLAFARCVASGSSINAMSETEAIELMASVGIPLTQRVADFLQENLLDDLAQRDGDFSGVFFGPVAALLERSSDEELTRAARLSEASSSPNAGMFRALDELRRLGARTPSSRATERSWI